MASKRHSNTPAEYIEERIYRELGNRETFDALRALLPHGVSNATDEMLATARDAIGGILGGILTNRPEAFRQIQRMRLVQLGLEGERGPVRSEMRRISRLVENLRGLLSPRYQGRGILNAQSAGDLLEHLRWSWSYLDERFASLTQDMLLKALQEYHPQAKEQLNASGNPKGGGGHRVGDERAVAASLMTSVGAFDCSAYGPTMTKIRNATSRADGAKSRQ